MNKNLLLFLGCCGLACSSVWAEKPKNVRPNVLIYLADDLGYGSINTYGAPEDLVKTPNLNQLADQGVQFNNAYTTASVCTPTRYSLLTGEYSWRSRLKTGTISKNDFTLIDPARTSMAHWMQQNGYKTAHVGKWHLGYKDQAPVENLLGDLSPGAVGVGFDYHFGVPYNLEDEHKVYIENNGIWGLRSDTLEPYGNNWYAKKNGKVSPYVGYDAPQRVTERVMTTTTGKAVEWLQQQDGEQPFFLYFAAVAVHNPIEPAPEMRGKSAAGLYGDFIQEVDHSFGRLVECLRDKGVLEDTLIIFASDNGGEMYASGTWPQKLAVDAGLSINGNNKGDKATIWEGGFKTPFVVSHINGRIPKGATSNARVSTIDLYATLADYLSGEGAPKGVDAPDSYSFKAELLQPGGSGFKRPPLVLCDSKGRKAVHFDHWKYIEPFKTKKKLDKKLAKLFGENLYDMKADPQESRNQVDAMAVIVEKGRRLLKQIVDGDDRPEWEGGSGVRQVVSTSPHQGGRHLKLEVETGATGKSYAYVFRDMPAKPSEEWTVSIQADLIAAPGDGKAFAQVKLAFFDMNGSKISSHPSSKLTSVSGGYSELSVTAAAPAGTVAARITPVVKLEGETGIVTAHFDSARLTSARASFEDGFEIGGIQ